METPKLLQPSDLAALRAAYAAMTAHTEERTFYNGIVIGRKGVGKTKSLLTMPMPLLLDEWDPQGDLVLSEAVADGRVWVRRWTNPIEFDVECQQMLGGTARGMWQGKQYEIPLSFFASYALDSMSTLSEARKDYIVATAKAKPSKENKGPHGDAMEKQDWGTMLSEMSKMVRRLLQLPLHCVFLGHLGNVEDAVTPDLKNIGLLMQGSSKEFLPLLTGEVYALEVERGVQAAQTKAAQPFVCADGYMRCFITRNDGRYACSSRFGLAEREPVSYRDIMRKSGIPCEDKFLLTEVKK